MALFLFFGGFLKYTTRRRHSTGRLNKSFFARELSYSLATLAAHYLKEIEFKKNDGDLFKQLEKPVADLEDELSGNIDFTGKLATVKNKLFQGNASLNNLSADVSWLIRKENFSPLIEAYPREKIGKILIPVDISYQAPGSKETIEENYVYALQVKVVANLIPVLSRFTLYVNDALCGDEAERFNLVTNDMYGKLKNSNYRPWVLDNGNAGSSSFPARFSEIINSPLGLVYMGGGKIVLGNCRGWNIPGEYGEGFHLLAEGRGDGLYTTGFIGDMALLNWETGLCDDTSDSASKFWYELIRDGFADQVKKSSIFRLMGTDLIKSPTLVFGDVYSLTLCAKAFKEGTDFYGPLPFCGSQARLDDISAGGSEDFDIGHFSDVVGNISLDTYNSDYASSLTEVPYNRALSYIITNYQNPDPMDSGIISTSDPLYDFIKGEAIDSGAAEAIPDPYSNIFSDVSDLNEMKKILEKLQIPGARAIKTIELNDGEKLLNRLKNEGFLDGNELDLNGWLYVKSDSGFEIENGLQLKSHGGIILEKGNIQLSNYIKSDTGEFILHLVTLDGNIELSSGVGGDMNVSLVAAGDGSGKGQVKFSGSANSNLPTINGNVAMQRLANGSLNSSAARGVEIKYFKELAALPDRSADDMSEKPLLMFSLKEEPELLE